MNLRLLVESSKYWLFIQLCYNFQLDLGCMTCIGLVPELSNMTTTYFQTLHIEPYYFCLSKVDEIRLPSCRTTNVKESM